ncbi:LuxR C-terminal-related transcriptional regulator [uncultured Microbacterium sp.]|uniref:LuxR C-terminal-related transcriptional regulator n=1 Tax=uncultured Microbacterium sp. TaxID=191216 RepID=UPI0028D84E22|nr:LuxR C-terminal-related transcriptional regulator [uncultured Microbacterium sp.]
MEYAAVSAAAMRERTDARLSDLVVGLAAGSGGVLVITRADGAAVTGQIGAQSRVVRVSAAASESSIALAGLHAMMPAIARLGADPAALAAELLARSEPGTLWLVDQAELLDAASLAVLRELPGLVASLPVAVIVAVRGTVVPAELDGWPRRDLPPSLIADLDADARLDLALAVADSPADEVYRLLPSESRRSAHTALGGLCADRGDSVGAAVHAAAAALGPDTRVSAQLEDAAAVAAVRGEHDVASELLERSVGLSVESTDASRRLVVAAEAAWHAGRADRVRELTRRLRGLRLGPRLRARSCLVEGSVAFAGGDMAEAYRAFMVAARLTVDEDAVIATSALLRAAEVAWWSGRRDRAAEVAAIAESFPRDGGTSAEFIVAVLVGGAHSFAGELEAAGHELTVALGLAESLREPRVAVLAAQAALLLGDDRAAATFHERTLAELRAAHSLGELPWVLQSSASVDIWQGNLRGAAERAEQAGALDATIAADATQQSVLAHISALRGNVDECRTRVSDVLRIAQHDRFPTAAASALWALGQLELGLGNPAGALAQLAAIDDPRSEHAHPMVALFAAPDLVEAATRTGRPELAAPALASFERWAESGGRWPRAVVPRLRALAAQGDAALVHFEAAVATVADTGLPFEEARTRLLYGEYLRRDRQRVLARTHLERAVELFDTVGAEPWAERARQELLASGQTTRRRDGGSEQRLTPRERQIADLVVAGASNQEVAARLFLSRKTVEYHLHKAYTKLGITSRSALADALQDTLIDW